MQVLCETNVLVELKGYDTLIIFDGIAGGKIKGIGAGSRGGDITINTSKRNSISIVASGTNSQAVIIHKVTSSTTGTISGSLVTGQTGSPTYLANNVGVGQISTVGTGIPAGRVVGILMGAIAVAVAHVVDGQTGCCLTC